MRVIFPLVTSSMTQDDKSNPLVRTAARVVIVGGIVAGVAILGTGGYFAWRHFAYQAAVKRCTIQLAKQVAEASARLAGKSHKEIEEAAALDESTESGRLAREQQLGKLVQDRLQNEIRGLEEVQKRLQAQRSLQQARNDLAEDRRGIDLSRSEFAVQIAGSPEMRLAMEERLNDLVLQQEQARINERRQLIGTERQMLQTQQQIQERQQQIQAEQLRLQEQEEAAAQIKIAFQMRMVRCISDAGF